MVSPGSLRRAVQFMALLGASTVANSAVLAQADAAQSTTPDESTPIDAAAMSAVDKMSAALQAMTSFHATSDVTTEVVLETGQKIQFAGTVDTYVRRPDAFKIVSQMDGRARQMYYNGKSFTIFAPNLGYYAEFPAPPTIGQTLDKANNEYGLEVPLADLFTWGTDQKIRSRVQGAMVIRPETIGDRTCMHYAFRQEKVDWQLWIDQGAKPLPCKIVITDKTDPAMPQYSAVLTWVSDSVPASEDLTFSPPASAHRIAITEVGAMTSDGEEK